MKNRPAAVLVMVLALVVLSSVAYATDGRGTLASRVPDPTTPAPSAGDFRGAFRGTMWIFDADFSTTTGDNAGWTSFDRSGQLGQTNRWHFDTLRVAYGNYAFWCGEENVCWKQPRGYGNDWKQLLSKTFDSGETGTGGDTVTLEFDQRYAMERLYDYGYVEVSSDGGTNFTTIATYNNTGFQGAGVPHDWTHPTDGHVTLDLSTYAGQDIVLQFRFESDGAYSSQDQADNSQHSVKDGAWEVDNIEILVNSVQSYLEDCEGSDTWTHDDTPQSGETGASFFRGQYYSDFDTGRPQACEDRDPGEYMYAAVDLFLGTMVDTEDTWLVSPPIYTSGYENLVGQWDMWVDLPQNSNDLFNLSLASSDEYDCVTSSDGFEDEAPGAWYGGPFWGTWTDDWTAFAGNDWLAIRWELWNDEPGTDPHMGGIFLNWQKVGVPSPDPSTAFNRDTWNTFHDWFVEELADAFAETARVRVRDQDGIATVTLMASNDDGATWEAYACTPEDPTAPEWFSVPPPVNQMVAHSEIHFYYEAMDDLGNITTLPATAPDNYYEFSILPLTATTTNPGILLVDKHKRLLPSRERDYLHTSEYYYREALGVLGYEWETFDVDVESGSVDSEGPDTVGMKYYDTQIWFASDFDSYVMLKSDQKHLISWLQQASGGKERNLLLTGNDISWELKSAASNKETLGFHDIWLAADYQGEVYGHTGASLADTTAGLLDHAGDWTFMDYGDGECILETACPDPIECPDIIGAATGVVGNEVVADYKHNSCGTISPAGVAYTHPTIGYQTIILGFGVELMMDGVCGAGASNYTAEGYYKCGIEDRVNLMGNIMGDLTTKQVGYFGLQPGGTPTDVVDGGYKNALSHAYPNPFNPVTEIAYSVKEAGQVTIEVYNVAGKVVRTLLNSELDAGTNDTVIWDGTNDIGEKCASGVYFYRINAPRFTESHKMVMLK